jgi:hypothetical protein
MGEIKRSIIEGEFKQNALYAYVELLQWNPFVQLIDANENF